MGSIVSYLVHLCLDIIVKFLSSMCTAHKYDIELSPVHSRVDISYCKSNPVLWSLPSLTFHKACKLHQCTKKGETAEKKKVVFLFIQINKCCEAAAFQSGQRKRVSFLERD